MIFRDFLTALELPPQSLVNQRVPKKHLLENGAPTAADKRIINEGIEEIQWVAALKPATIGVPAFEDTERQYLEIAVLTVNYREKSRTARLRELIHRAIPYPVVLFGSDAVLSLAELRFAQNEAGKTVIDGELLAADPKPMTAGEWSLANQPATDLAMLYRGWCDQLRPIVQHVRHVEEIEELRREAEKEPQMARRVEINLRIRELTAKATQRGKSRP
jgi:hypothetical protein